MRSKKNQALIVVSALCGLSAMAEAAVVKRICLVRGVEEVPASTSTAVGGGTFVIDTDANTVTYKIVVSGLTTVETAAHIHGVAGPGVNAGVLVALPPGPIKTGVWTYPEALEPDLLAGRMYVNVHTTMFPGGEVRGQIVTHVASLDGGQENPPNPSTAGGWGVFMQDPCANTLSYHIVFGGLSTPQTAAHIHGVANYGTNAGVLFPFPVGSPLIGAWNYPQPQEQNITDGLMYANIHTTMFGGGEIRGQIISCLNPMDGLQEVPPNPSLSVGVGMVAFNTAANTLGYDVRRSALVTAETAAHIHGFAPAGVNAGVQTPIAPVPGVRKLGAWNYGGANAAAVLGGRTYFNVHTTAFPGGEIRGQINNFPAIVMRCVADTDDGSGTGTPDCGVGVEDLLYYLGLYDAGSSAADVDDGTGSGTPDGGVGIEDLLYYLSRYDAGC